MDDMKNLKTKPMTLGGDFITEFVKMGGVEEVKRCLPELTLEQFEAIRAGRAEIRGNSDSGVEVVFISK